MHSRAAAWYAKRTRSAGEWQAEEIATLKAQVGARVAVVIPARNEEATISDIVETIYRTLAGPAGIVDELMVIDSLSEDATATRAAAAGALVHSVADIRPEVGVLPGKGEALWKAQFVTTADLLVFIDADLTAWSVQFVTGLLGPMLLDRSIQLVKGYYDRVLDTDGTLTLEGGRVTELVARPLLALRWPHLSAVIQPLAGEWAIRREAFQRLSVPTGYGVELATLLDISDVYGLDAVAQVDLGRRAHRHQSVHDLGVMATEILAVADRRTPGHATPGMVSLCQFERGLAKTCRERPVPITERRPAIDS